MARKVASTTPRSGRFGLERFGYSRHCNAECSPALLQCIAVHTHAVIMSYPRNSKKKIITHYYIGACPRPCSLPATCRSSAIRGCRKKIVPSPTRGTRGEPNSPGAGRRRVRPGIAGVSSGTRPPVRQFVRVAPVPSLRFSRQRALAVPTSTADKLHPLKTDIAHFAIFLSTLC